ncbi:CPBP family intramembrane glutamic endopeptidase [Phytopseudomonas dryadis]|uniref:CPBP family intramembrane metalloprotease n=1 Tax=Phytopseudomonas dryadis TaxID=2487520 RepID=A0A4V2KBH7_9GAMM|nr:CPBP family intramembrane glutamic endopeptidase [Pseudomonas dryadis]TBU86457.1 CPBP family intramembrane metalloprotease [Pseudomonas dryadis]
MPLPIRLLFPTIVLALGAGLGFIHPPGILAAGLFIALTLGGKSLPEWLWYLLVVLGSLLLAAHLLPGFEPWNLRPARLLSSDATPYVLRLSWDKLLVGSTLLAWWLGQRRADAVSTRLALLTAAATLLLVPALALMLGLVGWQVKWPEDLWLWLLVNLGVAVLAEELLFRGLLQPRLIRLLGLWPGLLGTALLFGAAHLAFSPLFALVAAVAGLGYGLAFHYSGRLSLAIALHGAVNLLHLLLLSYPLRLA